MKTCYALAAMVMLSISTFATAEEIQHKPTGLKFSVPKGWTCTQTGDEINIVNADKTVSLAGGVVPKEATQIIFADTKKFLNSLGTLSEVEITEGPEKETANELEQSWYSGTAKIKKDDGTQEEIEWDLVVVSGGKDNLFLVGIGKLDDNEETYEEFFTSFEKAE